MHGIVKNNDCGSFSGSNSSTGSSVPAAKCRNLDLEGRREKHEEDEMISYEPFFEMLEERGISQYQMAKYGVSQSTMQRMKNNQNISTHTIDRICHTLGCKIEDIMIHTKERRL